MIVIDRRNDGPVPGARLRRLTELVRLPKRLLRRARWGLVVALVLSGAYAWRGRDDGAAPLEVPPSSAEPPASREGPSSISFGRILVQLARDLSAAGEVTVSRLTCDEGSVEAQVASRSREALMAWAGRFANRLGPAWRLVTVATDEETSRVSGVPARIKWGGPASTRANSLTAAAGMLTPVQVDDWFGGLERMTRWSAVTRLDVDARAVASGRAASGRLPQATVTAQLTWAQLVAMVSDIEHWAAITEGEVIAAAEAQGDTLMLTARLVPRVGTPQSAVPPEWTAARGDHEANIAQADGPASVSPFASSMWRTGDLDPESPVQEATRRSDQSGPPATAAERWLVQGIVQAADGWRAAVRLHDGATRVVRVGDRLDGDAAVTAISWDGVRVSTAGTGSGRSLGGASDATTPMHHRQPTIGERP